MITANFHTHTPRCHHAKGSEREYIEQAIANGFTTLGFSDHVPQPFKNGYVSTEYVTTEFHIDSGETVEAVKEREKKAAEEKAKLTALQGAVLASQDETRLLGALIQCEAGNQSAEGMLAVGAVVMNRVRSSGYPNTISGVLFASGQFPPALNGNVAKVYEKGVKQACLDAAARAIAGETNVGTATHFKRAGSHDGVVIGAHVFW